MQALIKAFKIFVVLVAHKIVFCHQQWEYGKCTFTNGLYKTNTKDEYLNWKDQELDHTRYGMLQAHSFKHFNSTMSQNKRSH